MIEQRQIEEGAVESRDEKDESYPVPGGLHHCVFCSPP